MTTDTFEAFLAGGSASLGAAAGDWADAGPAWLEELIARWELELGDEVDRGRDTYVVAAERGGERPVTLQLVYPDGWFHDRVAALTRWDGEGAVALIDHDPRGALLLDRPIPGDDLTAQGDEDEALGLAADVLARLWVPAPDDMRTVDQEAGEWVRTMPARHHLAGRPFSRELIHEAVAGARDLFATPSATVLLHGDLRRANVLRGSDGYVAVDPRPLVGEREFDVTALVRDDPVRLADDPVAGARRVQSRFDLLAERLELDRVRLQMWSFVVLVDATLWSFESGARAYGDAELAVTQLVRELKV
jgi:streptomycin 6-kinase